MTYKVEFLRKVTAEEERRTDIIDGEYVYDETEFDIDADSLAWAMVDIMNLFNAFVAENGFEDITVTNISF